jgi:hypothetical protein
MLVSEVCVCDFMYIGSCWSHPHWQLCLSGCIWDCVFIILHMYTQREREMDMSDTGGVYWCIS